MLTKKISKLSCAMSVTSVTLTLNYLEKNGYVHMMALSENKELMLTQLM